VIINETYRRGMSEVINPMNLPKDTAALIENMYLDEDGVWKKMNRIIEDSDISTFDDGGNAAVRIYDWQTANMPADAYDAEDVHVFVVFYEDGTVALEYRTGETTWTATAISTLTDIDSDSVMAWSDNHQFVFVDGRTNNPAKRIRIDADGVVYGSNIAPYSSYQFPELDRLVFDDFEQEGTGIGRGGIFAWRALFINKFGEKSKPTPTLIVDTYQWQRRGTVDNSGEYLYSDVLGGSLKSAVIDITEIPQDTVEVWLYRADAYGSECITPMMNMRKVASRIVGDGMTSVQITDSHPYGVEELNVEATGSPSGDDVCLLNGTVFIANAVNTVDFPLDLNDCYINRITLNNTNKYNYVNRWFMVEMFDDGVNNGTSTDYLDDFTWSGYEKQSLRFFADDLITPLEVSLMPLAQDLYNQTGGTVRTRKYAYIKVPYVPAGSVATIYMVYGGATNYPVDYPNEPKEIDPSTGVTIYDDLYAKMVVNPVRGEETLITISNKVINTSEWLPGDYRVLNKANMNYERNFPDHLDTSDDDEIHTYDEARRSENLSLIHIGTGYENSIVGDLTMEWNTESIKMKRRGYGYVWVSVKPDMSYDRKLLVELAENENFPEMKLTVTDNNNGTATFAWTYERDDSIQVSASVTLSFLSTLLQTFLLFSWEQVLNPNDSSANPTKMYLCAVQNGARGAVSEDRGEGDADGQINEWGNFQVDYILRSGHIDMSHLCIQYGTYLESPNHALQAIRFLPIFENEFIGIGYTTQTISGATYYRNLNVFFEKISNVGEYLPGRIYWANGRSLMSFNEQNIHEEIQRIVPMKSFMPTDEHNTILLWTRRDRWRMPLFDDMVQSLPLKDGDGDGLVDRESLAVCPDGVAWWNDKGVLYLTINGTKNLSDGRMYITSPMIYPEYNENRIWVQDTGKLWYYDIAYDVTAKASRAIGSATLNLGGFYGKDKDFMLNVDDNKLYANDANRFEKPALSTRAFRIGRRNKLHRWTFLTDRFNGTLTYAIKLIGTLINKDKYMSMTPTTTTWTVDSTGLIYTHVTGNTTALVSNYYANIGDTYTVEYTLSGAVAAVAFGGVTLDNTAGTKSIEVTAVSNEQLAITPINASTPSVSNVKIYSGSQRIPESLSVQVSENKPTSYPNIKGEFVQFIITPPATMKGIELEVK
jgi:hypothetical protein